MFSLSFPIPLREARRCLLPSFLFIHQLTITVREEHTTLTTNATNGWERAVLCVLCGGSGGLRVI